MDDAASLDTAGAGLPPDGAVLLDRTSIHLNGSRAQRRRLHIQTVALKAKALQRRRELAAPLLDGPEVISRATGFGGSDLTASALVREAREECYRLVAERGDNVRREKGSVQCMLLNDDFGEDSAVIRLAQSPEILGPVARYFGMLPILLRAVMTRANAVSMLANSTHYFHLDPEDISQLKAFVHLTDVDEDCGPFTALPAPYSDQVIDQVGYREGRLWDEEVEGVVGPGRTLRSIGPPGTVTFCDTCRCLHYGGRPKAADKPTRDLLVIDYVLPTSSVLPRFEGDGKRPALMDHLRPREDEYWNALIGAIHA